ncbi:ribonuclease R family protein [Granulicella mallensis]|uniref:Ribonuclease R n=1 Tax=Granulicella mallensis TaxID=940614 RepID=A0A7W8E9U9_9BACT|nr:RNB domain-containing ribonuclease [Granulicella mallensis]MBB5063964.1 ribonuclease R [Granulicella mallensis]
MSRTPHPRSDRDLLARISRSPGGKAGYKQLIRELGLGGGHERRLLVEQLTAMVARRELVALREGLWAIPKPPESATNSSTPQARDTGRPKWDGMEAAARSGRDRLLSGRLDLHRDGFGFVRPEAGSASAQKLEDIFIPPNEINGAMQGDLVLVDEAPPGRDGRRSGRIARVLTRRNPTVVGIFHYARPQGRRGNRDHDFNDAGMSENYVTPLDERISGMIAIPEGAEVVASTVDSPHRMLGEEARKQALGWSGGEKQIPFGNDNKKSKGNSKNDIDSQWPLEGLAVDVEITSFPSAGRPARGRLIEVLGPPDAFGVDVEIIIRKHHLPHAFPAAVLAEATEQAQETVASLPAEDLEAREDFRGLPIVTIDGETARDFDDAVLVRELANGNTELQVHIADVSWYVRPGAALDTEARLRGTSVYFPDRAVPMLPHALSSGMCSLLPNEDRLVLSCVMEIDPRGEIAGYRVAEGVIRSVRRMTYTSVQNSLNASPNAETWNQGKQITAAASAEDIAERERIAAEQPDLPAAFDAMLELALRLNAKRVRRGSIDFDLPEPVVEFDPDGNMKAIVRSERGWSHRLIEEFMLSANECVATWLERQGIPSIYRIHEMPDPKRIVEFEETASGFGHSLGLGNLPVRKLTMKTDRRDAQRKSARGRDSRSPQQHEIPDSIPVTPQMYQKLVRRISGTPTERILAYLMLRSLKQARYAEKNEGHFALASPSYTHFTSPIRRYPDLIVHRLVRAMLRRGADERGGAILSTDPQPWQGEFDRSRAPKYLASRAKTASFTVAAERPAVQSDHAPAGLSTPSQKRASGRDDKAVGNADGVEPIAAEELNDIASESSQAERRAADAERELIEWKKMKFMADKVGEDFHAVILSATKYGFFVELDDMFIEGLVPLASLVGDFYSFRDTDRTIVGARTGHVFGIGQKVEVILDRIDRQQRRLQFALLPGTEPKATSLRTRTKAEPKAERPLSPKRSGKTKTRARNKKNKGRR